MQTVRLSSSQRKSLRKFIETQREVLEIYHDLRREKLLFNTVGDLILMVRSLGSQRFGKLVEAQVCTLLGLEQCTRSSDPDGIAPDGSTYEIKASDASESGRVNMVQYRPGKADFTLLVIVMSDGMEIFKIPDADMTGLFRWSLAHSGGVELRTTFTIDSETHDGLIPYRIADLGLDDKLAGAAKL